MDPLSIFDRAKSALAEIQISEVLKERLEFAIDKGAAAEAQIAHLCAEMSDLKAEFKISQLDRKNKEEELKRLRDEHAEDVRIHRGIEFRKGLRTGRKWMPFCPKCHCPAIAFRDEDWVVCSDQKCDWVAAVVGQLLHSVAAEVE